MAQVTVKSKFGNLGTIDESELSNALKHGFSKASNDEIQYHNDEIEHGSGLLNPALAFGEEAASTATFGLSRQLENATGLTTPEAQAARAEHNPAAHMLGIPTGIVADPLGAVGALGKIGGRTAEGVSKVIGKAPEGAGLVSRAVRNVPAVAAGAAVEGAVFGAGQSIGEHALGDPDLNAEKVISNIGYGALLSGGLGGALEGGANVFGKSLLKAPIGSMVSKEKAAADSFQSDIAQGVANKEAAGIQDLGVETQAPFKEFPKSLDEIQNAVKTNFPVVPTELPSGARLKEAVDGLPDLQFKPHNLQYESLTDQGLRDYYKTFLEGQSTESKAIRDYEALQKSEATTKLDNTIKDLAGGLKITSDPVAGGESAINAFSKQYEAEKAELKPLFKQFDEIAGDKKINPLNPLLKLHDVFPKIGKYLDADANGVFQLAKYRPSMSMSKNTYGAIKDLVSEANAGELTLSGLRDVRETMRDRLTINAAPRDHYQIGSLRKVLMDEMETHVATLAPDLKVRDTFKRYAQNEERRAIIEKILGGSISDRASFAKTIKPEDVLKNIFSNTVSTSAAKEILGKDFGKILGDYLAQNRSAMTDTAKNGFSSNKFATFLKGKNPELAEALADNPIAHKRLNDLTDYMRILPDSPSVNPSGTAKTLSIQQKIAELSRVLNPKEAILDYSKRFHDKTEASKQRFTLEEVLAGKHFGAAKEAAEELHLANSKLARIERFAENAAHTLQENVKAVFDTSIKAARKSIGVIGSKLAPSPLHKLPKNDDEASLGKHHDVFARINELQGDPMKMMDELEKSVASIYDHAPMLSQSIQAVTTRATQFLATKIPPQMPPSAFSKEKYEPSPSEIAVFERSYNIVEDPMHALHQLKTNDIVPETVEALSTVYPKLYDSMKVALIEEASRVVAKNKVIPYNLRQSISMFIGEPVDQSFSSQSINANQMVFQQSSQNQQQNQTMGKQKSGASKVTLAQRTGVQREREA